MPKYRGYCFFINNYTDDDIERLLKIECEYLVYAFEEAPTTGTKHIQGYIHFHSQRSVKGMEKLIPGSNTPAEGSKAQNRTYIIGPYTNKKGKFKPYNPNHFEIGKAPKGKGKRSDIDNVREMIKAGSSLKEISNEVTSYQSLRFAEKYLEINEPKRNWKTNVYWFYGETGTGKTKTAYEMFPDAWISCENGQWWQGYNGEENVIIDDFRRDFCKFHTLLRILDRYPFVVMVKGGSRQLLAKNIVITCPKHPKDLWEGRTDEDIAQLLRRITEIRQFGSSGSLDQRSVEIIDTDPDPNGPAWLNTYNFLADI